MSVKKDTEKKPKKKKVVKKTTKTKANPKSTKGKEKKELEQAVKKIPALIMKEKVDQEQSKTKTIHIQEKHIERNSQKTNLVKEKKIVPVYEPSHKGKTWLWTGVIIFAIVIFVLWVINISTMFYESKNSYDPAREIIKSSKEELQNVIKTFGIKESLSEKLGSIIGTEEKNDMNETSTDEEQNDVAENVQKILEEKLLTIFNTTSTLSTTTEIIQSEI